VVQRASVGTAIGGVGCKMPGGNLSVSSVNGFAGSGIIWATHQKSDATMDPSGVGGILFALDATDLNKPLWDSDQSATDVISAYAKNTPPMVANGRVYMATFSDKVRVYSLKVNLR